MEVTRSRAYKKNDQAFVEQKNGADVRRGSSATVASKAWRQHGLSGYQ